MKQLKRTLSMLLVLLMLLGVFAPSIVQAQTSKESLEEVVVEELKFYFSKVGYIDAHGRYIIDDVEPLENRAENGDEFATKLLDLYKAQMPSGALDFGRCVLEDYFGVYIDLIQGDLVDAFVGYLKDELWTEAAKILLKILGKSATKANVLATVGQLAVAAYNCWGEW